MQRFNFSVDDRMTEDPTGTWVRFEDVDEFIKTVTELRENQKIFFRSKPGDRGDVLQKCKALEKRVDEMLKPPVKPEPDLFGERA